jgi:hypothetical protein
MSKLFFCFIIFSFSYYYSFSQSPLNYSINSGSGNKKVDTINIDYVIGEPLVTNSNLVSIPLANLIDSTLGIYSFENYNFKMFPNPTTNYIVVSFPATAHYNIDLLDNSGKYVGNIYSGDMKENENYSLSLTNYNISVGAYLLHITSKQINTFVKIIKI